MESAKGRDRDGAWVEAWSNISIKRLWKKWNKHKTLSLEILE